MADASDALDSSPAEPPKTAWVEPRLTRHDQWSVITGDIIGTDVQPPPTD